jgi:hypothetical protein
VTSDIPTSLRHVASRSQAPFYAMSPIPACERGGHRKAEVEVALEFRGLREKGLLKLRLV